MNREYIKESFFNYIDGKSQLTKERIAWEQTHGFDPYDDWRK